MPNPDLPPILQSVLSGSGMTYTAHSQSEQDGQIILTGQLRWPGADTIDVVLYASSDMQAFSLHLWPEAQEQAPAADAPDVLLEVVDEWTFIQPVMFRLFDLEALALVTSFEGRTLTLPGATPSLTVEIPDNMILQLGDHRHDLYGTRPYREHLEHGVLLHWKALRNFLARAQLQAGTG